MNLMAIVLVGLFVLLALAGKREEKPMASPAPMIVYQGERSKQGSGLAGAIAALVMVTVFSVWLLGAAGDKALNRATSAASSAPGVSQPASEATPMFAAPNTIQL